MRVRDREASARFKANCGISRNSWQALECTSGDPLRHHLCFQNLILNPGTSLPLAREQRRYSSRCSVHMQAHRGGRFSSELCWQERSWHWAEEGSRHICSITVLLYHCLVLTLVRRSR